MAAGRYVGRFSRGVEFHSVTAIPGNRGQSNYVAAKAGWYSAAKLLAREMARCSIHTNVIAPGVLVSRMSTVASTPPPQIKNLVFAAWIGSLAELAAWVVFLCLDPAGYIKGQVASINDGMA